MTKPITFTALHDAKRNGGLVQWLCEMTPAQRVEAAQVCAANSRRSVSDWLRTFGELMDGAMARFTAPVAIRAYQGTEMYEVYVGEHRYHLHNAHDRGIAWMGGTGPRISRDEHAALVALWRRLFADELPATRDEAIAAGLPVYDSEPALCCEHCGEVMSDAADAELVGAEMWCAGCVDDNAARLARMGSRYILLDAALSIVTVTLPEAA
jgi:hypothetical protein